MMDVIFITLMAWLVYEITYYEPTIRWCLENAEKCK